MGDRDSHARGGQKMKERKMGANPSADGLAGSQIFVVATSIPTLPGQVGVINGGAESAVGLSFRMK